MGVGVAVAGPPGVSVGVGLPGDDAARSPETTRAYGCGLLGTLAAVTRTVYSPNEGFTISTPSTLLRLSGLLPPLP